MGVVAEQQGALHLQGKPGGRVGHSEAKGEEGAIGGQKDGGGGVLGAGVQGRLEGGSVVVLAVTMGTKAVHVA